MTTDATRTVRRFLRQFAREQAAFGAVLAGLPDHERPAVATALLLRLMLLCFLQPCGLLGGDLNLQQALARSPQHGGDFYRDVLRPLLQSEAPILPKLMGLLPPLESGSLDQLRVPNAAWAQLFAFFAQFHWQLDECAPRVPNAITPHILGAVLEKQLDQKQHGAYYTDDDVSAYIVGNTVIPWLLDALRARCGAAFDSVAWRLLQADPERYITAALRHGVDLSLPASIAAGVAYVAQRATWNQRAPASHGLPNETWRAAVDRRERYAATRAALASGTVRSIDDCVTLNLDLCRLALDLIVVCDEAMLQTFWQALTHVRVLDPTCGSGAFLLATARVLQPLYRACLSRMEQDAVMQHDQSRFPNQDAFIVHAIISNNLYGVDLMEEAVALCKLRLLLMLLAQADDAEDAAALLDVSLNVHCGNVLDDATMRTKNQACPERSRREPRTTASGAESYAVHHRYDVIVGNPPYLPHKAGQQDATRGYTTERCGNLYALVVERSLALLRAGGRLGMILPIASVSTGAMRPLQTLYQQHTCWHSHFAVRPGKLFDGVDMNLTITLLHKNATPARSFSTGYQRWSNRQPGTRARLFDTLAYAEHPCHIDHINPFPKHGSMLEWRILERMQRHGRVLREHVTADGTPLFYHSGGRYWRKALPVKLSSHYKPICVAPDDVALVFALLNSQLFYWYWISNSNCMDVVAREVLELPVFPFEAVDRAPFVAAMQQTLAAYATSSTQRARRGTQITVDELNFDMRRAKPAIDTLDRLLARCYGFGEEEIDFVLNYDIKYRLGETKDELF